MAGKALLASLGLHALSVLALAWSAPAPAVPPAPVPPPAEAPPIVVTLLPEPPAAPVPGGGGAGVPKASVAHAGGRRAAHRAVAELPPQGGVSGAAAQPAGPEPRPSEPLPSAGTSAVPRRIAIPSPGAAAASIMGGVPAAGPSGGFPGLAMVAQRMTGNGALRDVPGPPGGDAPDQLARGPDGSYVSDKTAFVATIQPDGRLSFRDKPSASVGLGTPLSPGRIKQGIRDWYNDPLHRPTLGAGGLLSIVEIHFDLTDLYMRAHGDDPYRYEKAAFGRRTEQQRTRMAASWRAARVQDALRELPSRLASIWGGGGSEAARRLRLFEAWDECAESDDEVGRAGAQVRAGILAFLRRSQVVYPAAELERLNARRRSHAAFAPY